MFYVDNKLQIRLVNHACIIIEAGQVKLLCDPWLSGSAFNNGWDLVVPNEISIGDLDFTHIWISHEHPDHFSPKDLHGIVPARRKSITVYYQETKDKKVKEFCESLGFNVQELKDFERYEIGSESFITSATSRGSDSWLLFEYGEQRLLNLNDCFVKDKIEIARIKECVGNIDVLMSQYSFANWVGNESDQHSQQSIAGMYLEIFADQARILDPKFVIPFANFTYFSHEENFYLNKFASKVSDAVAALNELSCQPIVLSPMQVFELGREFDNNIGLKFWLEAHRALSDRPKRSSPKISIDQLTEAFGEYQNRLKVKNDWSKIVQKKNDGSLPACCVYLTDHNQAFEFDITQALSVTDVPKEECAIVLSSDSLNFLLKHEWGRGTLQINGRFQANYKKFVDFIRQTQIAFANNIGLSYPQTFSPDKLTNPNTFVLRVAEGNVREHL